MLLEEEKASANKLSKRIDETLPLISFVLDVESGSLTEVPSLKIPKEEIKGSVGAGDAFCAGCLYGLYHDYGDKQLLEFASAAAACNLFEANSVDGMRTKNEIMNIAQKYERASL